MIEALKRLVRRVFRFRSSIDGRFVTREYAEAHPDTTTKEKAS